MSEELRPCPFCGTLPQANTWTLHGISETRYFCPNPECPHSVRTVTLEEWQTRLIEDELQKRIAELEAENERLSQLLHDEMSQLEIATDLGNKRCAELARDKDHLMNLFTESSEYVYSVVSNIEINDLRQKCKWLEADYEISNRELLVKQVEIAELEGFIGQLIKAGNAMSNAHSMWVAEEDKWDALVKDWEERER